MGCKYAQNDVSRQSNDGLDRTRGVENFEFARGKSEPINLGLFAGSVPQLPAQDIN